MWIITLASHTREWHDCFRAFGGRDGIVGSCLVWGSRNHVEKLGLEHSGFLVCLSHRGAKRLSRSRGAAAVKIGSRGKLWFMCRRKGITPGWKYVFAAPWSGSKWCARVRPYQSVPTVTKRMECRRDQFDKGTAVTLGLLTVFTFFHSE